MVAWGSCFSFTRGAVVQEHRSHWGTPAGMCRCPRQAWNAWCCRGQWGQSLKLLGEEAQGAVPSRAKQGIWRSMVLSAENRREKQPALVKLAGTFGEKSVILEQLTIKEHSPATIFHPNYFSDPPLRHVRCMFINKVNTQIPSPSHQHCGFWTDPSARGVGSTTAAPEIPQITRKTLAVGVNRIAVVWFNMNVFMYC